MANVGRVTRGYRITIPRAVREAIGLQVGDLIAFEVRDGQIIMTPQRLAPPLNRQPLNPEVVERVLERVEARMKGRTISTPSADLIEEARRERVEHL
jgi:AbrB family looped-hinge helix DNA binding protein